LQSLQEFFRRKKSTIIVRHVSGDDIVAVTAELLREPVVVGWFQGRAEYGPRALGGRSILANPAIPSFLSDAAATAGEAKQLVADLSHASTQIRRMSEELPGTLTRLDTTVRRVDHLVVSKSQDID
jgi:hypothetical protein